MTRVRSALTLLLVLFSCTALDAQENTATPPPTAGPAPAYENRLIRLAEVLGSIQYLRNLCGEETDNQWLAAMQQILDSETTDEPERRATLTAGYNRGFRAFASVYSGCTPAAVAAETRYRQEGAELASEIVARFGN